MSDFLACSRSTCTTSANESVSSPPRPLPESEPVRCDEKEPIGVERKVTVLPRSGSIGRQPARQRPVGRRDYHNRNGVIEKRIVPQRQTNIDSAQLVEL